MVVSAVLAAGLERMLIRRSIRPTTWRSPSSRFALFSILDGSAFHLVRRPQGLPEPVPVDREATTFDIFGARIFYADDRHLDHRHADHACS